MIKCEVIKEFTLERFDELKNIERKTFDTKGKLYVGDIFECTEEMAKYLMGDNKDKQVVVKVIEVKPELTKDQKVQETKKTITTKKVKAVNVTKIDENIPYTLTNEKKKPSKK